MGSEREALVRGLFEVLWNEGRPERAAEFFSSEYVSHDPADMDPLFRGGAGPEGVARLVSVVRSAAPDVRFSIDEVMAQDDLVMVKWEARGTHTGWLGGLEPTGASVEVEGIVLYRVREGKIVEGWHGWDYPGLMRQLGVG